MKCFNLSGMAVLALLALLTGCVGVKSGVDGESTGLVARADFNANQEWQPPQVMGRDFWNMLEINTIWGCAIKAFKDRPVYKESGLGYTFVPIFNKASNTVTIDAQGPKGSLLLRSLYDLGSSAQFMG